jgi:UDP-2,3-diacylglucosamine pyrophosphatase LpxH
MDAHSSGRDLQDSSESTTAGTPVLSLDVAEEHALLEQISSRPFDFILIASDLHLGTGCDPASGCYSPTENFFEGDAFGRWLEAAVPSPSTNSLLVLNGDVFDFLRVTSYPTSEEEIATWRDLLARLGYQSDIDLSKAFEPVERRYGLKTNDYKSIWKLERIVQGHSSFFRSLALWITAGRSLVIVKGNHDLELYWPLVRRGIRDALVRKGARPDTACSQVAFAQEKLRVNNVYIEHGHQYEAMTQVTGDPVLPRAPEEINLPLGSFMNRYLINKIERLDPFLDNVKPVQSAVLTLLRRYPASIFGTYARSWKFIWKAVRSRKILNGAVLTVAAALLVPIIVVAAIIASYAWPTGMDRILNIVPWLRHEGGRKVTAVAGVLFPFLLPYLLGAGGELMRELRRTFRKGKDDAYTAAARAALKQAFGDNPPPQVVYAVFGHTHVQRAALLSAGPRKEFYLNSGTWTALWSRDRPDLTGHVLRTFLRFDLSSNGEYRHSALLWDDAAGQPRLPILFYD